MTDIRRTILWVVFVTSLFLLWDAWNKHNGQPSLLGGPARPVAAASAPGTSASAGVPSASPTAQAPAGTVPQPAAAPGGEPVVVTTDLVKATFDSVGGQLVRLELLKYRDANHPEHNVVLMDRVAAREYVAQTGLITAQSGVALPTHLTPMTAVPGARVLADGQDSLSLRFESAPVDGRRLVKVYTFKRGDYAVGVRHEFVNGGSTPVTAQLYLQLARDGNSPEGESKFYSTFTGPAMFTTASKYKKIDFKDIAKGDAGHDKTAKDGWIAMVQHYFASAWIVNAEGAREFRTAKVGDNLYTIAMVLPLGEVAPGATQVQESQLFAGPQMENRLAELAPGLEYLKDYGWLMPLSKPLFWLLDELYSAIGNWGWAIVALVVVLKIAFFWLNASAYKSMAKMRAINPRVMEMRERLKDKPQQMQQEMMRIYREEKVNPLGGCLPILIQMPFFIALYWVLLSSVEMRNAPWIGWITDLSAKDPWFILPVLMTASSLAQVALGAKPPDPMQARLMWFMPLAFGVMFFFFPAGLVLYWLTNNVLSIAQQWYINKKLGVA
ncbi:membrane protein insertase YidC [Rubrivivax gelatinosus]|uniref:membrane protein insertase YidC n=1 Tax=Rubrivivax gelatinosus TaxID=28068 RepID=UPI0019068511|nr:membrane protein insertase YidC [Rubrivivax gelatinosus]MBK1612573.1 membrane protein insertase YidC [Rubrivivax gelatinosus]